MEMESILVVDDEEAIREVVSTMLESKGYRCTAVSNGRAAQEQVKRITPDLILSDMIMPEMDGIKLLDWIRHYDPEVPVIMVTAIHDISTALEAIRRGAYDYILKPFEKDQLFLGVGRALQHRRLVAENRNYQRNLEQQVEERTAQLTGALSQLEQSYDDTLEALGSALDLVGGWIQGQRFSLTHRIFLHWFAWIPNGGLASFAYSFAYMAVCFIPVWVLYRKRIFLKV